MLRSLVAFFALGLLVGQAVAQNRFNGVWTVSRGAGGLGRITIQGNKLYGVLLDSGWQQLTGDPRAGQVTGTINGSQGTVTVKWSTGQTVEFAGKVSQERGSLSFGMVRLIGGKKQEDTAFELQAHAVGAPFVEPFGSVNELRVETMRGNWTGNFQYGPYDGIAGIVVKPDGAILGSMAVDAEGEQTWSVSGKVTNGSGTVKLTVDAGTSKQEYSGRVVSLGPDQIRVTFDRDNGKFVLLLSRW